MSYLLAISSSPRRNGNSELLLDSFTEGVQQTGREVKKIRLNELNIRPCQACDRCASTGTCIVRDDMQQLYPMVRSARGMVLVTPIYFGSLSAQLKAFIDRFQCWWHAKYRLSQPFVSPEEERPGSFLCVGALEKPEYCDNAAAIVKVYYHNVNFKYAGKLCARGFDEKGSINENPDILEGALKTGTDFAEKMR